MATATLAMGAGAEAVTVVEEAMVVAAIRVLGILPAEAPPAPAEHRAGRMPAARFAWRRRRSCG